MVIYIYDGSFEGLLTAIYEAYYRREQPEHLLARREFMPDLFSQPVYIDTDHIKSEKVFLSIENKISSAALRHVFYAFLSETEAVGTMIYNYLQLGWQVGSEVDRHLADDRVSKIHQLSQKVSRERHRMLGLIRFRQLAGGIYYAPIEPDYNVTALVAPHFVRRLADQNWIIHDLKRGLAALYNQREWIMTEMDFTRSLVYEQKEHDYQQLWRQYFDSAAVPGRINPKLQRKYMPVRYWRHLIEK
ncbi:hypothetical protein Desca_0792 [Desulfotomaculum nigrificans CO-1-SRB]|uniref:DUF4130 domain-containing protein n=1 Tax=Desulfotomaculum nigrificans (strain DSM 14880 / VKM B-2319 / CO-1-SRB) TaxID=868595 RepID=F6B921_DESCC|nr:TIGR03915 family putative DNA repair protein [Desulfotomaculum nigrificans]AEF93672.1 hypothetical protein Desca_0792 [Desulfotomaculum nigrificans CO-1-SRB]